MEREHVALVSGGSSGIGAATVARLAAEGVHVLVAGRDRARSEAVARGARERGGRAEALELDVCDPAGIAAALARARASNGPIDWLVTSAGIAESAPLTADGQDELCERHLAVNFHGARRVMEALLPEMLEHRYGRIVHVASSAALHGYAYVAAYCASKHALLGHARAAAVELAPRSIAVQVLCPWYVDTPMTERSAERIAAKTGRSRDEARALLASQNPSGRLLEAEEVARAVLELCRSERGGVVLELDGGAPRTLDPGLPLGK